MLALALLLGCGGDDAAVDAAGRGPAPPPRTEPSARSPGEVVAGAGRLAGQEVRVTGEIDVLTDRLLTLGDEDLYVAAVAPRRQRWERQRFGVGDRVTAVGRLEVLDARALTRRLPGASILPSQFQGFGRRPVVLAERVAPAR